LIYDKIMKLTFCEQKMMKKRLAQLQDYMAECLATNKIDDYLNIALSRELKMLERTMLDAHFLQSSHS